MQPPPCQKTQSIIDEECTICGREMNLPFSLPCTHKFCYTCIKAHVEGTSATCPICRAVVSHSLLRDGEVDIVDTTNVWWNYASRDNASWWKYEPTTSTFIEEAYQLYLKDNRFVVARIYVSTKKYIIDFNELLQIPEGDISATSRKIKRIEATEPEVTKLVKGVAGWHLKGQKPPKKTLPWVSPPLSSSDEDEGNEVADAEDE